MKLENLLKQYRKDHALTQEEMAEKIGINRCLYNQIEKGKTKVRSKTIEKVAKALYLKPGNIVDMLKGE